MLLTRKNPLGGRRLTTFPIVQDKDTGQAGFKLGYCRHGEEIVCLIGDASEIAKHFGTVVNDYYKVISKLQKDQAPRVPITVRLAKWLVKDNVEYAEKLHTVEEDFKTG